MPEQTTISRPASSDELDHVVHVALRRINQRLTTGRRMLIATLAESPMPQTIPMLLRRQPKLAQSSVYRNLGVLEQAGLVDKIEMGADHAHYELSEKVTGQHHHHLMCTSCGSVTDVVLPSTIERSLAQAFQALSSERTFTLSGHRLDLVGHCAPCVANATGD